MNETGQHLSFLRELTWSQILVVLAVLISCRLLSLAVRWIVRRAAESAPSHRRLLILRMAPIARLLIWIAGIAIIIPLLIEPTFEKVVALVATLGLALAFAIKDRSCYAHRGLRSSTGPRTHRASSSHIQGMSLQARPESTEHQQCSSTYTPRRSEAEPR